jgi:uncharacterized surface anchored protein
MSVDRQYNEGQDDLVEEDMITSNASGHKAHEELGDTGFTIPVEMIILALILIVAGAALYFNEKRRRAKKKAIA